MTVDAGTGSLARSPRPPRAPSPASAAARRASGYVPAVLVFIGGIVVWELIVGALNLKAFILPRPSAIVGALVENWGGGRFALLPSWGATMLEAVAGLVIGTTVGVLAAFATARWVVARNVLLPVAVAANAIPIIAFAPLMNNWFGTLSPLSKAMMAALLVFFPVMAT